MTQHLQMWISIVALALTAINVVWSWVVQSRSAAASKLAEVVAKVAEVECDVEDHGRRIQSVESDLKHLPSRQEIADLKLQLAEISGHLRVVESEMTGAVRAIRRFEDHLIEGGRV
ncbi:DUF2730 family protein [Sphingomonas silueang]|uniref:DUF2730 family protein n=1 Tax=Sphingomonas silueang TaxID=3156617 RepID=UPI0032B377A7